ncbi:unnamed protein product, partial [Polarella glacialis]
MAEANVNDGIKERRQELIKRLNKEHEGIKGSAKQPKLQNHTQMKFTVADKIVSGGKAIYEFWTADQVNSSKIAELESTAPAAPQEEQTDVELFKKTMIEHNIDPSLFGVGKAKPIEQLALEVQTGASRLMLDATEHKKLVRVVDVVVLKLRPAGAAASEAPRLLIEMEEKFPDGRTRPTLRLPGTKREPHENARQTAERILSEMLNIKPEMVTFDFSNVVRQEEEIDSPSFPGVRTVYRKELVECIVSTTDPALLLQVGITNNKGFQAADSSGNTKMFEWMTEREAESKQVKLKVVGSNISTLVRAPIGMDEEALADHLKGLGVDPSLYGKDGAKTLKEFSSELIKGETRFGKGANGDNLVVTEVVVLIIRNDGPTTLVQTHQVSPSGDINSKPRLPGAKRRPDENQFLSARRIIKRQLEIDDNAVRISGD